MDSINGHVKKSYKSLDNDASTENQMNAKGLRDGALFVKGIHKK